MLEEHKKSQEIEHFTLRQAKRLSIYILFFSTIMVIACVRLWMVMVVDGDKHAADGTAIQERERSIKAPRGIIYDRNGNEIATNQPVCQISVIHRQITDEEKVINTLVSLLEMDEKLVRKKVEKISAREIVKANVDKATADKLRKLNLDGVVIDEDYARYYPYETMASKVVGFTGGDNQGILGLEVSYNDYLTGKNGSINTTTDASGMKLPSGTERRVEPEAGNNLYTTLDMNIQTYIEQKAIEVRKLKNAKRVCIIVMNPQNGEILGLADVPEYNLNKPFDYNTETDEEVTMDKLNEMWRCFCISDSYEPGSTFKMVTATTAFENGVLNETDNFFCPGYKIVEDRKIRCHKVTGHGAETFRDGIMNSCNPVFIEVGARVGVDNFYEGLGKLGLFEKTGVDLPGEANSIFHKKENVGSVELATMSFGQSFQVTPMQMLRMTSCIVNGGTLVTPHFGLYITDSNDNITQKLSYDRKPGAISKETSDRMKELLRAVVAEGTGHNAYVSGYDIGGKTATSEKLPRRSGKYIASFMGFAPVDDPQVLTLILIDEPEGVYYGGTIAAPVVGDIYENILPYLNIDKEEVSDEKEIIYIPDTVF